MEQSPVRKGFNGRAAHVAPDAERGGRSPESEQGRSQESERVRTALSRLYTPNIAAWNTAQPGALPGHGHKPGHVGYHTADARSSTARVLPVSVALEVGAADNETVNENTPLYPGEPTGWRLGTGFPAAFPKARQAQGHEAQAQVKALASPRQQRDYSRRVTNMMDAGLSDNQILQHPALRDSKLTLADVAALRLSTLDPLERCAPGGQAGTETGDRDRGARQNGLRGGQTQWRDTVMELLQRGYTDLQILKHHLLEESGVTDEYVAWLRQSGGVIPGQWLPGMGRLSPAVLL